MTIREFVEKDKEKYACMNYVLADDVIDLHNQSVLDEENKDIDDCEVVDMNMYEYILYLESENDRAWEDFDDTDVELKSRIEKINVEKYEYSKDDKFVVIFANE
jgi:hypothetical protein